MASSSVSPSGAAASGGFGTWSRAACRAVSAASSSVSRRWRSALSVLSSSICFGCRLPLELGLCFSAHRRAERGRARYAVCSNESVERLCCTLARERSAPLLGRVTGRFDIDHVVRLVAGYPPEPRSRDPAASRASITVATPSTSGPAHVQSETGHRVADVRPRLRFQTPPFRVARRRSRRHRTQPSRPDATPT